MDRCPRPVPLLLLLAACEPAATGPMDEPTGPAAATAPVPDVYDDEPAPDPSIPPALLGGVPYPMPSCAEAAGLPVTFGDELSGELACDDPLTCTQPYLDFLEAAADQGEAPEGIECRQTLAAWMQTVVNGESVYDEVVELPPEQSLGKAILGTTGMGFLFEPAAFWSRPLHVVELSRSVESSFTNTPYERRELVLLDPWVGQVEVLHLLPMDATGPVPTVVVMPGHYESAEDHLIMRQGQYLPENGFAAMILDFRAYGGDADALVAERMLCQGMSLMMVRAYEALLAMKVAAASPESCAQPIGVLGHSGGSAAGNLLLWLEASPAVVHVSDMTTDYAGLHDTPQGVIGVDCEFHPGLAALSHLIHDDAAAPRAIDRVPYGYSPPGEPEWPFLDPYDLRPLDQFVPTFRDYLLP